MFISLILLSTDYLQISLNKLHRFLENKEITHLKAIFLVKWQIVNKRDNLSFKSSVVFVIDKFSLGSGFLSFFCSHLCGTLYPLVSVSHFLISLHNIFIFYVFFSHFFFHNFPQFFSFLKKSYFYSSYLLFLFCSLFFQRNSSDKWSGSLLTKHAGFSIRLLVISTAS